MVFCLFAAKKNCIDPVKHAFVKISNGMRGGTVDHEENDPNSKRQTKASDRIAKVGSLFVSLRKSFREPKFTARNSGSSFWDILRLGMMDIAARLGAGDLPGMGSKEADVASPDQFELRDAVPPLQEQETEPESQLTVPDDLQSNEVGLAHERSIKIAVPERMPERMFVPYLHGDSKASVIDVVTAVVARVPSELDLIRAKRLRLVHQPC